MAVNQIAKKQAENAGDCRLWSARDALEDTLASLPDNVTQIAIHWLVPGEGDTKKHKHCAAGLSYPEHIALLATAQHQLIADWFV